MKKRFFAILSALMVAAILAAVPAEANHRRGPIEVMSQNLYLGADISRLLSGEPPAAILQTVLETDYPGRATEIAQAIDDFNPDVIGLQEVWTLTTFDGSDPTNPIVNIDFLDILMAAIANEGESYAIASVSTNADVTLPLGGSQFGRVIDSDVILYRTSTTSVSNATTTQFSTNFTVPFGEASLVFNRGYHGVDVHFGGKDYRFVNTHLEVEGAPCATANGGGPCQDLQAAELLADLADETLPVILVGDFNAAPGSTAYGAIDNAGFLDTWTIRYPYNDEPGYTCCQDENLANVGNNMTERIDHIFVSEAGLTNTFALTTVVGDWDQRKTAGGLWYSDHGGPYARMWLTYNN